MHDGWKDSRSYILHFTLNTSFKKDLDITKQQKRMIGIFKVSVLKIGLMMVSD